MHGDPTFCDRRLRVLLFAWVAVDAAPSLAVFCFCVVVVVIVDVVFIVGPRRGRQRGTSGWHATWIVSKTTPAFVWPGDHEVKSNTAVPYILQAPGAVLAFAGRWTAEHDLTAGQDGVATLDWATAALVESRPSPIVVLEFFRSVHVETAVNGGGCRLVDDVRLHHSFSFKKRTNNAMKQSSPTRFREASSSSSWCDGEFFFSLCTRYNPGTKRMHIIGRTNPLLFSTGHITRNTRIFD